MDAKTIQRFVIDKSEQIAEILRKGKDCELRKTSNGISVIEVSKKTIK